MANDQHLMPGRMQHTLPVFCVLPI